MRLVTALALSVTLAFPAAAAVVHDEGTNGDLSSDAANPTPIVFLIGSNTIIGSDGNPTDARDYITFTIPAGQILKNLNLIAFAPDNPGFASFNSGSTSFIPSAATNSSFLAGIHPTQANVGSNLMPLFVSSAVTTNSLPAPELQAGTYCFLIQQTSAITQTYQLEFVLDVATPTQPTTWGRIKSLYQ